MAEPRIIIISWIWMAATTLGMKNTIIAKRELAPDTLEHEKVHLRQAREMGSFRFLWRWLFSKKWRVRIEAEAYAVNVRMAPMLRQNAELDWAARCLSGPLYMRPCTFAEAKIAILTYL
jgi:hypothetical protein